MSYWWFLTKDRERPYRMLSALMLVDLAEVIRAATKWLPCKRYSRVVEPT